MADAELLALLLRTGLPGCRSWRSRRFSTPSVAGAACSPPASRTWARSKGLGARGKRAEIAAVLEIARRTLAQQLAERPVLSEPQAARQFLQLELGAPGPRGCLPCCSWTAQLRLIQLEPMFRGTLTATAPSTRARWPSWSWVPRP